MKLLYIAIFIIFINGCGGQTNDSQNYPQTENKPSDNKDVNWDKGAWDNFKWQ